LLTFYPCSIRKTSLTRLVLGRTHQPLVPHELGSSWTWTRWIKGCPSCSLNVPSPSRSILLHMFWTSPFNASLSFFALALVIGPIGTSNGSLAWLRLVLGWSASFYVGVIGNMLITYFLFAHFLISFGMIYSPYVSSPSIVAFGLIPSFTSRTWVCSFHFVLTRLMLAFAVYYIWREMNARLWWALQKKNDHWIDGFYFEIKF